RQADRSAARALLDDAAIVAKDHAVQIERRLLPSFHRRKRQVLRIEVYKRSDHRTVGLVVCEKRADVNVDVLRRERRGERKVRYVANCWRFALRFFFTDAKKAEARSQRHPGALHLRLDVMKFTIERLLSWAITNQVITALILEDVIEPVTVRVVNLIAARLPRYQ